MLVQFKLCKVRSVQFGQKGIPYLNTYDGRTIRYPDPLIKANDTIKLDLENYKIVDYIKFDVGNVVMVTGGRNRGRVGVIKNREKHKGSFETIHVQDATGHEFATRLGNVFTIGKGTKPWVSLPKGKGIKLSIIEEAKKRLAASQNAAWSSWFYLDYAPGVSYVIVLFAQFSAKFWSIFIFNIHLKLLGCMWQIRHEVFCTIKNIHSEESYSACLCKDFFLSLSFNFVMLRELKPRIFPGGFPPWCLEFTSH